MGLAILRMAALLAEDHVALDAEISKRWPLRSRMAPCGLPQLRQSGRSCGGVLPEVAALFGEPQLGADQYSVDIGLHSLNALAEAARRGVPVAVRFALLVMNVAKPDSPPEHLPIH